MEKDYKEQLEVKYYEYGMSFLEQFGDKEVKNIHDHTWKEFLEEWNSWSEKEKQDYLYYISSVEGKHYLRWFFWFVIITSFLVGFSVGYYF